MLVAAFFVHAADPFAKTEIRARLRHGRARRTIAGPGKFSLDARLFAR
jgi:hypothetical protein